MLGIEWDEVGVGVESRLGVWSGIRMEWARVRVGWAQSLVLLPEHL